MALTTTQLALIRMLADGQVHSGVALGESLGISRAAVWKALKNLATYGLVVEQRAGSGYWLSEPLDLLNADEIAQHLTESSAKRCELVILPSCESTNSELRDSTMPAAPGYRAVLSEHQSAGRGRQGRPWRSTFGQGVYCSIGQELDGGLDRLAAMSLVIGVGVCRALDAVGITEAGLKWPNDLWIQDKKLGGILLEADGEFAGPCRWIAGVGVNWRLTGTVDIDQDWTDVYTLTGGQLPSRNQFCALLIEQMMLVCERFSQEGLEPFLPSFEQRDVLRGRAVSVTRGTDTMHGTAEGLTHSGELIVRSGQEVVHVSSGEVSVRPQ
ncbi:MAG: biotin--[acetyl-CoA-carboxylase] ligase [Lysobacterales bacterium]